TQAALAARQATSSIPIVMGAIGDPMAAGVVTNLAHPGGNITGLSSLAAELEEKRLELLRDLVPRLARVAVLSNPTNPYCAIARDVVHRAAKTMRLEIEVIEVASEPGLAAALAALTGHAPDAVLVLTDPFLAGQRNVIASFMTEHRVPAAYSYR